MTRAFGLLLAFLVACYAQEEAKVLEYASGKVARFSAGLGIYSRSTIVATLSRALRREDGESVRESLNQAIVTLVVLDVGGGVLAPIVSSIVDYIAKDPLFRSCKEAWWNFGTPFIEGQTKLEDMNELQIKNLLKSKKAQVMREFNTVVGNLPTDHKVLPLLRKAKFWLKVKTFGKVIGPIFDLVGVGVNAWALGTAIRDCVNTNVCNGGAIASASLSIASGLIGLITFAVVMKAGAAVAAVIGPIGAIAGALLAITATLIEIFYKPPPDQTLIENLRKEALMRSLDSYAKLQVYHANQFFAQNNIERNDLYVVNQGHLPKFFKYSPPKQVIFGKVASRRPRGEIKVWRNACSNPTWGEPIPPVGGFTRNKCQYLEDGNELESTLTEGSKLGFDFYGFTKGAQMFEKWGEGTEDTSQYEGSTVLIPTDKVQESFLSEQEIGTPPKLRSIVIDTNRKGGITNAYNDLVAIGDMPNLDSDSTVNVQTGSGSDALNIDGRLGPLTRDTFAIQADLKGPGGTGINTVSFEGMSAAYGIKGVKFDAKTGHVDFFRSETDLEQKQSVGYVRNVQIVGASPFKDYIKMWTELRGDRGFDFTVIKARGLGTYEIDLSDYAYVSKTWNFRIIDNSKGSHTDNVCQGHTPVLKIIYFGMDAVANDVLYQNGKIRIYGKRSSSQRPHGPSSPHGKHKKKKEHEKKKTHQRMVHRRTQSCSGEQSSHPEGGKRDKVLIATVAVHSKCPVQIQTENKEGNCMMSPKLVSELDKRFFKGSRTEVDFSQSEYTGSDGADYLVLKCPSSQVTAQRLISPGQSSSDDKDFVMIEKEHFLDACSFNEETSPILAKVPSQDNTWVMQMFNAPSDKFDGPGRGPVLRGKEFFSYIVSLKDIQDELKSVSRF